MASAGFNVDLDHELDVVTREGRARVLGDLWRQLSICRLLRRHHALLMRQMSAFAAGMSHVCVPRVEAPSSCGW